MSDHSANWLYGVAVGSAVTGATLPQINEWLQAGAFVVAIISGLCAARYYWRKSK